MGVAKLLGKIGQDRGAENENRAMYVLNTYPKPEWLKDCVKATFEEESESIDIVCHSDVGKLFLQIKSSETGRINARNSKNRVIVVVNAKMSDMEIHEKIIAGLESMRSHFRKQRGLE